MELENFFSKEEKEALAILIQKAKEECGKSKEATANDRLIMVLFFDCIMEKIEKMSADKGTDKMMLPVECRERGRCGFQRCQCFFVIKKGATDGN